MSLTQNVALITHPQFSFCPLYVFLHTRLHSAWRVYSANITAGVYPCAFIRWPLRLFKWLFSSKTLKFKRVWRQWQWPACYLQCTDLRYTLLLVSHCFNGWGTLKTLILHFHHLSLLHFFPFFPSGLCHFYFIHCLFSPRFHISHSVCFAFSFSALLRFCPPILILSLVICLLVSLSCCSCDWALALS